MKKTLHPPCAPLALRRRNNGLRRRDIYDHPEIYGTVVTNYSDLHADFVKPADLPAEDVFIVTNFNADAYKTTKPYYRKERIFVSFGSVSRRQRTHFAGCAT